MIRSAPIILVLSIAALGARAQQADITWSSSFLATNLDSSGIPFDSSFSFYLGVFDPPPGNPGWLPDETNTAQWSDHWITADVALYDAVLNFRFASGYNLEALVEGVNLTGKKGYIWGVKRETPGEWILITGDDWSWPEDGGIAFPKNWTVNSGTAVLGEVNQDGIHMRTAQVSDALPPLLRSEMWRQLYFSSHELENQEATVSGWQADPNGNGRSNLVEYALGANPHAIRPDGLAETGVMNLSGAEFLTLSVTRNPNSDAILQPQVSTDLVTWLGGPPHLVVETQTPTSVLYRDTTPITLDAQRRFLRLQVSLPLAP